MEDAEGNFGVATRAELLNGPWAGRKVDIDNLLDRSDSTRSGVPTTRWIERFSPTIGREDASLVGSNS